MTTSQDLLVMVFDALVSAPDTTAAGSRVYQPGDWPTQQDQYPIVKLRLASEDRQSLGRSGAVQFTSVATVQILGEVSADAEAGNAGAAAAEAALWSLKRQIEVAVVNSYPLTAEIQQIASMRTQVAFDSSGATHLATMQIDLALEFYEGSDSFAPVISDEVDEAHLEVISFAPHPGFTTNFNP